MSESLAHKRPDGTWSIDSFAGRECSYVVDLEAGTCSCPHYTTRLTGTGQDCKHLAAVRRQADWVRRSEIAKTLTDAALLRLLAKYTDRGDVVTAGALRCERESRRQRQAEETELKKLFG